MHPLPNLHTSKSSIRNLQAFPVKTRIRESMASRCTYIRNSYLNMPTHIVYSGTTVHYALILHVYSYAYVTKFPLIHANAPPLLYLSLLIKGGCSFLHMTLCSNKSLRDRRSGHPRRSCITSVIQSIILQNHVTYKDVPTHHSVVYHARVLYLPLRYISKLPQ